MNIDRRLDRLAERQALLQRNVDWLAEDERKGTARRAATFAEHEAMMAKNQVLLAHVLESIDRAERIATARKQPVTGPEDRQQ